MTRTFLDAGWRAVVPVFADRERDRLPAHECVSSRAALKPFAGAAGYIVAKAAVLAFVDVLATEYRDDDIRANAILPSVIDTPANRAAMPDADWTRWVAPEQIASVVRMLCEDGASVVSGAHVPVYGRA